MREKRGVEIDAVEIVFFGEIYPRLEIFVRIGVAVHFAFIFAEHRVAGVKVQALLSGHQRKRFFNILFELIEPDGFSGIISRRLNAAFERIAAVEAEHVVALPAMHADRDVFQPFKRAFRIYAVSGVRFFCFLVLSHFCFSLMILFARILAAKNARSALLLFLLYYDLFVFVKRKENKSLLRAF